MRQSGPWFRELALRCGQFFHFTPIDCFDQCVSGGKVTIQSSGSNASLFGDIVQAGVRAETGKRLLRHFQDALAIPLRIRARFSRGGCEKFRGHVGSKKNATGDSLRLSSLFGD